MRIFKVRGLLLAILMFSCSKTETVPTIKILSPTINQKIEHFSVFKIEIETEESNHVDYYIDGNLINYVSAISDYCAVLTTNYRVGNHNLKVVVTNNDGKSSEQEVDFLIEKTDKFETGILSDIEDNEYNTVKIGSQWWMAENLRVTKYNDGEKLKTKAGNFAWSNLETGAFCWYNNDSLSYANAYGALYNWYAVETEKLCPAGWHVPSHEEWMLLEQELGMDEADLQEWQYRGNIASSIKASYFWNIIDDADYSGFSALPSGFRSDNSDGFMGAYDEAIWWTSTDNSPVLWDKLPVMRAISVRNEAIYVSGVSAGEGYSVRCLKD